MVFRSVSAAAAEDTSEALVCEGEGVFEYYFSLSYQISVSVTILRCDASLAITHTPIE